MPYVVGTYRDKRGSMNALLGSSAESLDTCRGAVRWQLSGSTGDHFGRKCTIAPQGDHDYRTAWHVADPVHEAPFTMVCRDCGEELSISRGAFTWEAFHRIAREIWGDRIPLTVAEFRLSRQEL